MACQFATTGLLNIGARRWLSYGHTPVGEPEWLNRTINIDTGCVFGGKLPALRYPERELVSVPALRTYYDSAKPFLKQAALAPTLMVQQQLDDLLDIEDVIGKRIIRDCTAASRFGRECDNSSGSDEPVRG
jgi:hypothetical protein